MRQLNESFFRYIGCTITVLLSLLLLHCSSEVTVDGEDLFSQAADEISDAELYALRSDFDTDGDGLTDNVDPCPDTSDNDADQDGVCEAILSDINGDGCVDLADREILVREYGNRGEGLQSDLVPDGVINIADVSVFARENGLCKDNCPGIPNPDQTDENSNDIGDRCEEVDGPPPLNCGNGVLDEGEACEGSSLRGHSCSSLGFDEGTLKCSAQCELDTTACVSDFRISNVIGSIRDGQSLQIQGSNFGEKTTARPIKFDRFEAGSNGAFLTDVQSEWEPYKFRGAKYSSLHAHSGNLSAYNDPTRLDSNCPANYTRCHEFDTNYFYFEPSEAIFVSYWFRTDNVNDGDEGVGKLTRVNSTEGTVYSGPGEVCFSSSNPKYGSSVPLLYNNGDGSGYINPLPYNDVFSLPENEWVRVDMEMTLSDPGVANGYLAGATVGHEAHRFPNLLTRVAGKDFKFHSLILGLMSANVEGRFQMYIDDLYVDNTLARVEIANHPILDQATHREMQVPTSWSASALEVEVNVGSFSGGEQVYIFVVDRNGNASPGYGPITVQ